MDTFYLCVFYFLHFITKISPKPLVKVYCKLLGSLAYKLNKKHKKIILANLKLCFPSQDEAWLNATCKQVYINYVSYFFDVIDNFGKSREYVSKKFVFLNPEIIDKAYNSKKSIILSTAHLSNWELLGYALGMRYDQIDIVGRALESPKMNALLEKSRKQFGATLVEKTGAARKLVRTLRKGGFIALLCDQDAINSESSQVMLFNTKVNFINTASKLAKKHDSWLLPVYIYKEDDIYKIYAYEAMDANVQSVEELTLYQAKCVEEMIKKNPSQYFFFHRRFKRYSSHIYE